MKNIAKYSFFLFIFLITSCAQETIVPVIADFSITVVDDDYTVPVKVKIQNNSQGADTYEWDFEGATVTNSNEINPQTRIYNQAGKYTISLKASNRDGEEDKKSITFEINKAMSASFSWEREGSAIAPVTIQIINSSEGAKTYQWKFENGNPSSSNEKSPKVVFTKEGKHLIQLIISNGKETYSSEKTIKVLPEMTVDFDWSVDIIDQDYQAPVLLHLKNKTVNATSFLWKIEGPETIEETVENPDITLNIPGKYSITLRATNDKETKEVTKEITILPNKNLLNFSDIKLGINTAQESIGCFFSSKLEKVLTKNQINEKNGALIDFAYFGLNDEFTHNQIVSPDKVQNTAFRAIPNAIHTKIINRQDLTQEQLSSEQFDLIEKGSDFKDITVIESDKGKKPFNKLIIPRIILLETSDGRKGAVKVKSYTASGKESYITVDIKIQKEHI